MIGNAKGIGNFEFDAITTVDINSQKVFRDVVFSWGKRFVCPSSAVGGGIFDILIDPTGIDADRVVVMLPVSFTAFGAGPIFVDLYANPTVTAATGIIQSGSNRDNRSTTLPKAVITFDPIVTAPGAKLPPEFMIPSDGVPAVSSFGGEVKDDLIFIANRNVKYMFRLINQEANPSDCAISLTMFEAEIGK